MTKPNKATAAATSIAADEPRKRGWDEIESLFDDKKKQKETAKADKEEKEKSLQKRKKSKQSSSRQHAPSAHGKNDRDWVDDGLGGKFNSEGFTGRVEDGVKVFKAHVLYKDDSGKTKDCPFDCNCCFI